jgi:hypothetical protein
MILNSFPTFLTFLALCPVPAGDPWDGLAPSGFGSPAARPEGKDLAKEPELPSASEVAKAPPALPGSTRPCPARFLHCGIRYTAGVGSPGGVTASRRFGPKGEPMPASGRHRSAIWWSVPATRSLRRS